MPQKKQLKLVTLRQDVCRMTQQDLAEFTGRSVHSIRALEYGKFEVSEGFALQLSRLTRVDPEWLLSDSPGPPVDSDGHVITHASFLEHLWRDERRREVVTQDPRAASLLLLGILERAKKSPNYAAIAARARKFLEDLDREVKSAGSKKKRP